MTSEFPDLADEVDGLTLRPIAQDDLGVRLVDAVAIEVECDVCASPLRQVNAGCSDGRVARWVGECCVCERQYVLAVEMVRLPTGKRR